MKDFTIGTLMVFGLIVMMALSCLLSGWVLTILWSWFVVPFGLAQIGIAHGIGICLTGRIVSGSASRIDHGDTGSDPFDRLGSRMVILFGTPLLALLIGWLAQMFM